MKLAENLKLYREENDMTQDSVATELRISRQSVSKWENGESYPSIDNLIILSRLFNKSIDELIMGEKFLHLPFTVGKPADDRLLRRPVLISGLAFLFVLLVSRSLLLSGIAFIVTLFITIFLVYANTIDWIYQAWTLERNGIHYLEPTNTYNRSLRRTLAIIRKKTEPFSTTIAYDEIASVELVYEKKIVDAYLINFTSYNLLPFFSRSMRDPFYFLITRTTGEKIKLDLTVDFHSNKQGYQYLSEIMSFFESKGYPVKDSLAILAIQQGNYNLYHYIYHGQKISIDTNEKETET